ncbi:hypothetical protein AC1031_015112 [Aphanomyces cochlioides]|nr:hypothetical protein AC1031_015112 [Aphanomyces cochlioides]
MEPAVVLGIQFSQYYSQCLTPSNAPPSSPSTAPSTAAPTTKAPVTAAPTTKVPVTAAPTTATPVTTAPTTKAPTAAPTTAPTAAPTSPPSSSSSIYFGAATDYPTNYGTIVPDNFNLLVSENGMKWDAHERSAGVFDFSKSLAQIAYAKQKGLKMRGHCLVWHNQMPTFYCSSFVNGGCVSTTLTATQLWAAIETRIQKTFAALNDPTIIAWDVLNEAVADDGSGLKRDVFYNTLGPDYVTQIFTLARKYAPAGVKLFYNDYNCDAAGAKADACFNLVKGLKAKGLVDGMGFQMHLMTQYGATSQMGGMAANFKRYSDLGIWIHVTEMDVGTSDFTLQAQWYAQVATNCQQNPKCEAFVVWGVSDKDSWRAQYTPLLFDANLQKKPAFNAAYDVIKKGH